MQDNGLGYRGLAAKKELNGKRLGQRLGIGYTDWIRQKERSGIRK